MLEDDAEFTFGGGVLKGFMLSLGGGGGGGKDEDDDGHEELLPLVELLLAGLLSVEDGYGLIVGGGGRGIRPAPLDEIDGVVSLLSE